MRADAIRTEPKSAIAAGASADREFSSLLAAAVPAPKLRGADAFWREARAVAVLQDSLEDVATPVISRSEDFWFRARIAGEIIDVTETAAPQLLPRDEFWLHARRKMRQERMKSVLLRVIRAANAAVAASAAAVFVAASAFALVGPARAAHSLALGVGGASGAGQPVAPGTAMPAVAVTAATGAAAVSFLPVAVQPAMTALDAVALPVSPRTR